MLEARNLKKEFPSGDGTLVVFDQIDFTANPGEFIMLTGRSGSGKSTLLYQLGLLDTPSGGEIVVDGASAARLSRPERTALRLTRFGYVFQDYGLLPEMSAIDNVMVPLLMRGMSRRAAREQAREALARAGLERALDMAPGKLSGGQQQRVSIARAIAHNPPYLLADEPTANLDHSAAQRVLETFGAIHKGGTTIIMVTHEQETLALASRILELRDGRLIDVSAEYRRAASPRELRLQ